MLKAIKNILARKKKVSTPDPVQEITPAVANEYTSILSRHIPYFNELMEEEKQLFLKRAYMFQSIKKFHFIEIPEQKEIPILISAVAVQITFGLNKYLLPYFKDIYILPDVYKHNETGALYIGHVSPNGIYISWKHFLQGFETNEDNFNVAFHELAHAVHHENFTTETGVDWDFREDFKRLPDVFGPILSEAIIEKKSYLRGYAFTNFYEFWAVSIEAFFENPKALKENMPSLYHNLCEILNQDPLAQYKRLAPRQ